MGRIVVVAYRSKPGRSKDLRRLLESHLPTLRAEGLATRRPSALMQAADGTLIEVFEWASREAIESAHGNPAVQNMWAAFAEVCDFIPIGSVAEADSLFSEFEPLN
jgi:quinol monooxygenase YgiN